MTLLSRLLLCLLLLGCQPHPAAVGNRALPSPGSVVVERTMERSKDGSEVWGETVSFVAPQTAKEGTSVAWDTLPWGPWVTVIGHSDGGQQETSNDHTVTPKAIQMCGVRASFGAGFKPEAIIPEDTSLEKWIFFGGAAIILVLGGLLVGIGKHFKLGGICLIVSLLFTGLGIGTTRFPFLTLAGIGIMGVIVASFFGFNFWTDYKLSNRKPNAPQTKP